MMVFSRTFILLSMLITLLMACKSDTKEQPQETISYSVSTEELIRIRDGNIVPNITQIVSDKDIARIFEVDSRAVEVTNRTSANPNRVNSVCFYNWEDWDLPNNGIMVSVSRDPSKGEFPDYIKTQVQSFKSKGYRASGGKPIVFQDFPDYGNDGAYSLKANMFVWQLGDLIKFEVVFNTTHTDEEKLEIGKKLAAHITETYLKK